MLPKWINEFEDLLGKVKEEKEKMKERKILIKNRGQNEKAN